MRPVIVNEYGKARCIASAIGMSGILAALLRHAAVAPMLELGRGLSNPPRRRTRSEGDEVGV